MGLLWKLEPATAAKHRLYERYLDAWWPILLQPTPGGYLRPRVTYVDAFAGPGCYEGGEDGSPILVLHRLLEHTAIDRMRLSPDRVCLLFIEKELKRYKHLRGEMTRRFGPLRSLPVRVEIRHGEAGLDTGRILDDLGAWSHPILAIFDSWGNVNVPLELVGRVARNKSSEVITTFGPNWFSRRENLNAELLDVVFGGRAQWESAGCERRPDERWRAWLATYRDAMLRAGFQYRLNFQVVPRTGQSLYLVYGTNNGKGVEVMKEAMWKVDNMDGMSFRDPRTRGAVALGQLALWEAAELAQPELRELISQRLGQGAASLEDLERWLLLETARWRKQDARTAVKQMQEAGIVVVSPRGRLTRASIVMLR